MMVAIGFLPPEYDDFSEGSHFVKIRVVRIPKPRPIVGILEETAVCT